jgi:hypothetical protein
LVLCEVVASELSENLEASLDALRMSALYESYQVIKEGGVMIGPITVSDLRDHKRL